jgi:branched-chain amino acid transport system ATP-binding protein
MEAQALLPCCVLAYGDVKRLELALALASRPRLLLMDEPTAGMSPHERAALMALTRKVVQDNEIGVLFTEHDMGAVFGSADRIMVIVRGRVIASGSADEVSRDPQVQDSYLGRGFADLRKGGAA